MKTKNTKTVKILAISTVIIFYLMVPLLAQKYYNKSAIKTSFAITVTYFIIWKLYNNRKRISKNI
jgi:hypothetical protein